MLPVFALLAVPREGGAGSTIFMVQMVLIFAIFYFLMIRPQAKERKKHEEMLNGLKKGDEIVTSGGIHGVISNLKDDTLSVKIAENVKVEITRSAVSRVKEGGSSSE